MIKRVSRHLPGTRFFSRANPVFIRADLANDCCFSRTSSFLKRLLVLLIVFVPAASAEDLDHIAALVRGGASDLALQLVNQNQPPPANAGMWMVWEKERYAIYASRHDWDAIAQRTDGMPAGLPDDFVQWALTRAAAARLSAGDGAGARHYLRRLLWQERGTPAALAQWRQMILRSYLLDNDLADAETAVLRYQQDFHAGGDDWNVLHATILLRANRNRAALAVLAGVETYQGRILRLLAGLRSGDYKPAVVLARALKLAHETASRPPLQRQAWILVTYAAARAGNVPQRLSALERALNFPSDLGKDDPLFHASADDLWSAYDRAATSVGNKSRLLIGDDAAWLKKAATYRRDYAPYARACYAFLAFHGSDPKTREIANGKLADSLYANRSDRVVRALYTRSSRYKSQTDVPDLIRYRMADRALAIADFALAGQLMQGLNDPPPGEDADEWSMRRARVLIYAGNFKTALKLLGGILDNKTALDDDFVERYLQVIFDLQTAQRNREAETLLKSLFPLVKNKEIQRQILFWRGDSMKALGEYTRAAELYLRSATYDNESGGDIWGQTARFHAAEALAKAGLIDDARSIYLRLLRFTMDPARRAVIERNIQQLWLLESRTTVQ